MAGLDQTDAWLARLENAVNRVESRMSDHSELPWHAGYGPTNTDFGKRLDRIENGFVGVARWVIGILAGILVALSAILGVAWKILESKPPS